MTLQEVAQFLKMNERTVLKLASEAKIPGVKIGHLWRFDKYLLIDWIRSNMRGISSEQLQNIIEPSDEKPQNAPYLSIDPACIKLELKAASKQEVLKELVEIAEQAGVVENRDLLLSALAQREALLSTAIEEGIAIPHARNNSKPFFKRSTIIFGRSVKGVDFASPDNKPTHHFFLVCPRNDAEHLRFMAQIARALKEKEFVDLIASPSARAEEICMALNNTFLKVS